MLHPKPVPLSSRQQFTSHGPRPQSFCFAFPAIRTLPRVTRNSKGTISRTIIPVIRAFKSPNLSLAVTFHSACSPPTLTAGYMHSLDTFCTLTYAERVPGSLPGYTTAAAGSPPRLHQRCFFSMTLRSHFQALRLAFLSKTSLAPSDLQSEQQP